MLTLFSTGLLYAAPVTTNDVSDLANNWLAEGSNRMNARMGNRIRKIQTHKNARSETLCHIVSLDPAGYIIVAPDDQIEPIIAFSDSGSAEELAGDHPLMIFLNTDLPERKRIQAAADPDENPDKQRKNLRKWSRYTKIKDNISVKRRKNRNRRSTVNSSNKNATDEPTYGLGESSYGGSSSISDVRISPFIESKWSQGTAQGFNCYNYYTPNNYYAGCLATAMAQIMRFYEYPSSGIGLITNSIYVNSVGMTAVTRGGDGSGGAYNWSKMPLIPSSATYSESDWAMIGALCYDAGVGASMNFGSGTSTAYFSAAQRSLTNHFSFARVERIYTPGGISINIIQNVLDTNLSAGRPVFLGISDPGGHAVICDGFGYSSGTEYHHLNMGWGGASDAWYNLPNIDSSPSYSVVDSLLFNIFTNETGEILAGRVIDNSSNGLSGAAITITPSGGGTNYTDTTDSKGYYGVHVPSADTYSISANISGRTMALTGAVVGTSAYGVCGNLFTDDIVFTNFSFSARSRTNSVVLTWTDPTATGMSNETVSIRWKTSGYPTNISDGTLLYSGTAQTVTHTNLTPYQTYYYRIAVTHDGSTFIDPPNTNLASSAPQLMPVKLLLRTSDTTGSGADLKAACRVLSWNTAGNGVVNSTLPTEFTFKTKWTVQGSGNVNPYTAGDEVILRDTVGTFFTLYFNADGSLAFDTGNTNSVHWTSYNVAGDYDTNNPTALSVDAIADVNGDGTDELIVRSSETSILNGLDKSEVRVLFYDDNASRAGRLVNITNQPAGFNLATKWTIEGAGIFNNQSVSGSATGSEQLLLRNTDNGAFFIIYFKSDGTINFVSEDTNHVSWTSWNAGSDYETNNPTKWSISTVGDINGDGQDEVIIRSSDTFIENNLSKSIVRTLLYDSTGTTPGKLRDISEQPAGFNLAEKWVIQGAGEFNCSTNHIGDEILIKDSGGNLFLIYYNDNGTLEFDANDPDSVYWTSLTMGTNYSSSAGNWSIQGIGDMGGDRE